MGRNFKTKRRASKQLAVDKYLHQNYWQQQGKSRNKAEKAIELDESGMPTPPTGRRKFSLVHSRIWDRTQGPQSKSRNFPSKKKTTGSAATPETLEEEEEDAPQQEVITGYQPDADRDDDETGCGSCCGIVLKVVSVLAILLTFPVSLCFCVRIVQEYERAIIFRLGRALPGARGPGLFFIIPCIDSMNKVDLRTVSFDVPPQEILTKDSVTVSVDAVVYYRINDPVMSVINVEDASRSTRLLSQTTLRNILGTKTLSEILGDRDHISQMMQNVLDEGTDPWGVKVERVEVKDVRLPLQLQRAMAAEAEAAREARAKVIAAEGEMNASRALKEASDVISESSSALQLRYLQTLTQISAEKNSTIIFPLPLELMGKMLSK